MSLSFDNLKSDAGLKQLDAYLQGRTFVFGCGPSTADSDLVALVGSAPYVFFFRIPHLFHTYITLESQGRKEVPRCREMVQLHYIFQRQRAERIRKDDSFRIRRICRGFQG